MNIIIIIIKNDQHRFTKFGG